MPAQVDLKDKWRNLVRQGAVNPDLFPSPEGRSKPRAAVENEQRERDERSAAAAGGASHGQAAEVPHVENAQTLPHSQGTSSHLLRAATSKHASLRLAVPEQLPGLSACCYVCSMWTASTYFS